MVAVFEIGVRGAVEQKTGLRSRLIRVLGLGSNGAESAVENL